MGFAKAVRYRVEQFVRALTARRALSEARVNRAAAILSPRARALFFEQAPQDQRHSLEVYETLLERGYTNTDLLAAALLHDVGKVSCRTTPWQRGLLVMAERFAPRAVDRLSLARIRDPNSTRMKYRNHAAIGANLAAEAGCSTATVDLVRNHEREVTTSQTEHDDLLRALQAADSVN